MLLLANRKARMEYEVVEKFTAGVVLSGAEVKSLRNKSGSLHGSYVKILSGEAFIINAQITPYQFAPKEEYDPKRSRKLLLKKKEILLLTEASERKGVALIPLAFVLEHNKIKLEFAIAKGKKLHDRRKELKERAISRDTAKEMKWGR